MNFIIAITLLIAGSNCQRFQISLNGLWKFKVSTNSEDWHMYELLADPEAIDMPVPSSFNDVTTNNTIRDHIGNVWYQRFIEIPNDLIEQRRITLQLGGAHYFTKVDYVGSHTGGHVPFEFDVTKYLKSNKPRHKLTIMVNNRLTEVSIPQGYTYTTNNTYSYPPGYKIYSHDFDYFDYAGLNGNVNLLFTRNNYIDRIHAKAYIVNGKGVLNFAATIFSNKPIICSTILMSPIGSYNITSDCNKKIIIQRPVLWWPIGHKQPGQLYTLTVYLRDATKRGELLDSHTMKIGFRSIEWKNGLLLNNKTVYLKGFGMHQDSEIRGRGFDYVQLTRDINLLKWIGANAVRTSHYPYFKEFLDFTDRNGIMVILETPACSLKNFSSDLLRNHKKVVTEIINNFANHPSIVMWSLANEPLSNLPEADNYFSDLINFTKQLDDTRPVTFVTSQQISNEKAAQHADVICFNRYSAWYQDGGKLDLIAYQVSNEITAWAEKYKKPVIITEFGAASLAGFHELPSSMWTENYHIELLEEHYKAFDCLKAGNLLSGEMIWNFADFKTPQEYFRPGFCAKGVFTRNRQPKSVAYAVQKRFLSLKDKDINCSSVCQPHLLNFVLQSSCQ